MTNALLAPFYVENYVSRGQTLKECVYLDKSEGEFECLALVLK